jgi:hypothetical protein
MILLQKMRGLGNYMRVGLAALALMGKVYADDFAKGVCPPTGQQLETMLIQTNTGSASSFSLVQRPKYFGKTIGGIAILPYTWNSNGTKGMGDSTFLFCVLAKQGTSNYIPFLGMKFPSGELSSKTYDLSIGTFATYWLNNKKAEVDGIIQYTNTGATPQGINQPNQLYLGIIAGGLVAKNLRMAAGPKITAKTNGDYQLAVRAGVKYIVGDWFFEVLADKVLAYSNMPGGTRIEVQARRNPPKK